MVGPAGPPTIVAEGAEDTGAALSDVEEAQRPKYRHRSPRRKSRSGPQGVGPSPPGVAAHFPLLPQVGRSSGPLPALTSGWVVQRASRTIRDPGSDTLTPGRIHRRYAAGPGGPSTGPVVHGHHHTLPTILLSVVLPFHSPCPSTAARSNGTHRHLPHVDSVGCADRIATGVLGP